MIAVLAFGTFTGAMVALGATPAGMLVLAVPAVAVGVLGVLAHVRLVDVVCAVLAAPHTTLPSTPRQGPMPCPDPFTPPPPAPPDDDSRLSKIENLIVHGATPGERAAALDALRRMGARS